MNLYNKFTLFLLIGIFAGLVFSQEEKIDQYKICEGSHEAIIPVVKTGRDWWMPRHDAILDKIAQEGDDMGMIFIGDSITHAWETRSAALWEKYYAKRNPMNLGFSGDRTQNVLWRLDNGEIDNIDPRLAVVMIGTNNVTDDRLKAVQIADGVIAICKRLREKLPETKILLLAVFPRDATITPIRQKVQVINKIISSIADDKWIYYLDLKDAFVDSQGLISSELMDDFLHPTETGYLKWAKAMEPTVDKLWNCD